MAVGTALCLIATGQPVLAGGEDEKPIIVVGVQDPAPTPTPGPEPEPADCWWNDFPATAELAEIHNAVEGIKVILIRVFTSKSREVSLEYYSERAVLHRYDKDKKVYEYKRTRDCREGYQLDEDNIPIGTINWKPTTDPDPMRLLSRKKIVSTEIDPPVPNLSPPPDAGVPVNLGVWFAVKDNGPYTAYAELGPRVWARRTATLFDTTFDPGNGTKPIECSGIGTPIPDTQSDTIEEGPCGTYRDYDDVVNDDLTVTVTSRWQVTWELSDGRSGTDPGHLSTTTSFPYNVYEIQTVGTANP